MKNEEELNIITGIIIKKAIEIHIALRPGLLESTYKECLYYELINAGLVVEKEKAIPIKYKGLRLETGYRIDLLVENSVVIELKAAEKIIDVNCEMSHIPFLFICQNY